MKPPPKHPNRPVAVGDIYRIMGERCFHRRWKLGMSQGDVAEAIDMSRVSYCNFENGRQRFPLEVLIDLCAALDMTLCQLLKGY